MILLINACVREGSRTRRLAQSLIEKLHDTVEEVRLSEIEFRKTDEDFLRWRDGCIAAQDWSDPEFDLARQFARADRIVVAAPFWDLSFPSALKQYFEHICVLGVTFHYTADDMPEGLCRAKALYYVTTAGGPIFCEDYGFGYVKALAQVFYGIRDVRMILAEMLDIQGADVEGILRQAENSVWEAVLDTHDGNAPEYDFATLKAMENSPLAGKKICILGSSVAYGLCAQHQAVGEYLSARFGAELTKEAVSGTTLADMDETSYVSRMRRNLDPKAGFDLFICQLSTNDASKGMPLGEIRESTEFPVKDFGRDSAGLSTEQYSEDGAGIIRAEELYDTSTITGAMESIIRYAKETWNCPVVFFTGSRFDSPLYAQMVERLYQLKEKWGIGILDLWSDDAFNEISEEDRRLYMNDPIHPTKAGCRLWWGPELERQLLAFLT